jgi:hypothetical protein
MNTPTKPPKPILLTAALIALDALFWLVFVVLASLDRTYLAPLPAFYKWTIILLALGSSTVLTAISLLVFKRHRLGYILGLPVLSILAVLSILDEAGALDLFAFFLSFLPLLLLIRYRKLFPAPVGAEPAKEV